MAAYLATVGATVAAAAAKVGIEFIGNTAANNVRVFGPEMIANGVGAAAAKTAGAIFGNGMIGAGIQHTTEFLATHIIGANVAQMNGGLVEFGAKLAAGGTAFGLYKGYDYFAGTKITPKPEETKPEETKPEEPVVQEENK